MKKLTNQGRYGTVFSFVKNNKKYVLKRNTERDVHLKHEWDIMTELYKCKENREFLPEPIDFKDLGHSQEIIMRYVEHTDTLYNLFPTLSIKNIENIYLHLIYMLEIMQTHSQFTHYDLHFNNILLVRKKGGKRKYGNHVIPITKYVPIFIDFGFSHCKNVSGIHAPMTQTHRGMIPIIYNPYYDIHSLQYQLRSELHFNVHKWPRMRYSLFQLLCNISNIIYGLLPNESLHVLHEESLHEESLHEESLHEESVHEESLNVNSPKWITFEMESERSILETELTNRIFRVDITKPEIFSEQTHILDPNFDNIILYWISKFKIYYTRWLTSQSEEIKYSLQNKYHSIK